MIDTSVALIIGMALIVVLIALIEGEVPWRRPPKNW